ncbi:MAG: hypothetical protein ACK55Z_12025, partial [bacterium]
CPNGKRSDDELALPANQDLTNLPRDVEDMDPLQPSPKQSHTLPSDYHSRCSLPRFNQFRSGHPPFIDTPA